MAALEKMKSLISGIKDPAEKQRAIRDLESVSYTHLPGNESLENFEAAPPVAPEAPVRETNSPSLMSRVMPLST